MQPVSVVIITLNEENNIVDCIRSAKLISDDIIVVDSGSSDETVNLARKNGAQVFVIEWQGFGHSRNYGASKAHENWIMSLDADERITPGLAAVVRKLNLTQPNLVFRFRRENYIGRQKIRYGTMGFDKVTRIYNRDYSYWDGTIVHEKLSYPQGVMRRIDGKVLHYGFKTLEDYRKKSLMYAQMSAEKYALEGRRAGIIKRYFSPLFNSLKSYIFQFGFLDGRNGLFIALNIASYTWLKYYFLHQLNSEPSAKNMSFTAADTGSS